MSPKAQRIAIAEAVGWTAVREQDYCEAHVNPYEGPVLQYWEGVSPNGEKQEIPDYLGSLDAIAEARKSLSHEQREDYLRWLGYCGEASDSDVYGCVDASALSHARAILHALNLWTEAQP